MATDADRLAGYCGWTLQYDFVENICAGPAEWRHEDGRISEHHPMSTLDAVASSLPEGCEWERIDFSMGRCFALTRNPDVGGSGDSETEARIAASLAAWEAHK